LIKSIVAQSSIDSAQRFVGLDSLHVARLKIIKPTRDFGLPHLRCASIRRTTQAH
jgi:hypothetical protein